MHPLPAVTLTLPLPPAEVKLVLPGEIATLQVMPACVTTNVWPSAVTAPVRNPVEPLASTVKLTVPLPLPLLVVCSQLLVVPPVHAQPLVAVTVKLPLVAPEL